VLREETAMLRQEGQGSQSMLRQEGEESQSMLRQKGEGRLRTGLPEMHRMQGRLQQDWLQGLQAQGAVQEELQEITTEVRQFVA